MTTCKKKYEYICSFDIGSKNFSFCIDKFKPKKLKKLAKTAPPKKEWFGKDGKATEKFKPIMKKIVKAGKVEVLEVVDLTEDGNLKLFETKVLLNMTDCLESYKAWFDICDYIVVEQQMQFGHSRNTIAVKLMQHCISWFLFHYRDNIPVIEYPAYYKTRYMGCPRYREKGQKMNKYWRKKWAVQSASEILLMRKDDENLDMMKLHKKKADDMGDTIIQAQSYKISHFLEKKF